MQNNTFRFDPRSNILNYHKYHNETSAVDHFASANRRDHIQATQRADAAKHQEVIDKISYFGLNPAQGFVAYQNVNANNSSCNVYSSGRSGPSSLGVDGKLLPKGSKLAAAHVFRKYDAGAMGVVKADKKNKTSPGAHGDHSSIYNSHTGGVRVTLPQSLNRVPHTSLGIRFDSNVPRISSVTGKHIMKPPVRSVQQPQTAREREHTQNFQYYSPARYQRMIEGTAPESTVAVSPQKTTTLTKTASAVIADHEREFTRLMAGETDLDLTSSILPRTSPRTVNSLIHTVHYRSPTTSKRALYGNDQSRSVRSPALTALAGAMSISRNSTRVGTAMAGMMGEGHNAWPRGSTAGRFDSPSLASFSPHILDVDAFPGLRIHTKPNANANANPVHPAVAGSPRRTPAGTTRLFKTAAKPQYV